MKLEDIIALAKAGYKPSDIKELVKLAEKPKEPEDPKDPKEPEEPEETPTPTKEPEPTFTSVNDTVYVKKKVNVRESYTTSSKSYGLLEVGSELTRLGIGDNGWTKVRYDGGIAYISSGFLTNEKP